MEEGEPGAAEEVVATEAAVEVVEEVPDKADPDKAEALKPVVVATGTVVLAILMGLQIRPAGYIGNLESLRTFVWIRLSAPGRIFLHQDHNQINETVTNSTLMTRCILSLI